LSSSSSRRPTTVPSRPQSHTDLIHSNPLEIHTSHLELKVHLRRSIRSAQRICPVDVHRSVIYTSPSLTRRSSHLIHSAFIHASGALRVFSRSYSINSNSTRVKAGDDSVGDRTGRSVTVWNRAKAQLLLWNGYGG
ncbi:hypothetical protein BDN70DRAFT_887127, partial [Pholiota conissans]